MFEREKRPEQSVADSSAADVEMDQSADRAAASRMSGWLAQAAGPAQAKEADGGGGGPSVVSETPAGAGAALPDGVRSKMEGSLGADFSGVRVHESADVGAAGAKAVARGEQIHMAPGQFDPNGQAGQELLGHELTHVVQQRAGRVDASEQGKDSPFTIDQGLEAEADRAGAAAARGDLAEVPGSRAPATAAPQVAAQPKLAGTAAAMKNNAGKGGGRYSSWTSLIARVKEYESLERKASAKSTLPPSDKQKLLAKLSKLELTTKNYLQDPAHKTDSQAGYDSLKSTKNKAAEKKKKRDERDRAEKRFRRYGQAKMLLKRVRLEKIDISKGKFKSSPAYSDARLSRAEDDKVGGNVNTLDEVEYGDDKGYFKPDRSGEDPGSEGVYYGINEQHANLGSRSVAMSRLDTLLGGNVNAKTEFATHTGSKGAQQGTFQKGADGKSGEKLHEKNQLIDIGDKRKKGDNESVDLADPELQRQLNILQIIDAIAGQVDRHWGNFFIQVDEAGRVQQVTGIDLDMAFGKKQKDPTDGHAHFKGIPMMVDKQFGERLLGISDDQIKEVLGPLLSKSELGAALSRWHKVKGHVLQCQAEGKLVDKWDVDTARAQNDPDKSYLGMMRAAHRNHRIFDAAEAIARKDHLYGSFWVHRMAKKVDDYCVKRPNLTADHCVKAMEVAHLQFSMDSDWQRIEAYAEQQVRSGKGKLGESSESKDKQGKVISPEEIESGKKEILQQAYEQWATKNIFTFLDYLDADPEADHLPAPYPPIPPLSWVPKKG